MPDLTIPQIEEIAAKNFAHQQIQVITVDDLCQTALSAIRKLDAVGEQLEFDRTAVAAGITAIKKTVDGRYWLTEGRGPYEWNDDNWHKEFRYAALEILAAVEPLATIAANWKGCPQTTDEVAKARIDLKERIAALTAERDALLAGNRGHGQPCYYCQEPCNDLAANPGKWSIPLCHAEDPGKIKWHHTGCVSSRLAERDALRAAVEKAPHGLDCDSRLLQINFGYGKCDCWKAAVPRG